MSEIANNPMPMPKQQSLSTSDQAHLLKRPDVVSQGNADKMQEQIKLPFAMYSEKASFETNKRLINRKNQQVANISQNDSNGMTSLKDLPKEAMVKIKRRLKSTEKAYKKFQKLFCPNV